jgi:predicted MPP superfamily phosphohydrolase
MWFVWVFLFLYGIVNFYIYLGLKKVFLPLPLASRVCPWIFSFFSLSYIAGRSLGARPPEVVSDLLLWIGSFWFAVVLYSFLGFAILDLYRLLFGQLLGFGLDPGLERKARVLTLVSALFAIGAGYWNGCEPKIRTVHINLEKKLGERDPLRVAVISDLHLGTIVGEKKLRKIVGLVQSLKADLILLPGDILDEDPHRILGNQVRGILKELSAPFGVYAVTGNHEYLAGVEKACSYLEETGIRVLRDEVVKVGDSLYIVGREDRSSSVFAGRKRASLRELLANIPQGYPILVMDHQPVNLHEAEENGVDIQVSGHTHHGQLFPLNYITELVYEVSWGYVKKGGTHIYVSCGVGTWGPPVRLGSRPEIVELVLTSKGEEVRSTKRVP